MIAGVVLAAGAGRRFGGPKQLAPFRGRPLRLITRRGGEVDTLRASYYGELGYPVLLERSLFERVGTLPGDAGARELLRGSRVRVVACDGLGSPADVDTGEQLEALQRSAHCAPAAARGDLS